MTNEERDAKITETHTAVMVMAVKVNNHDNTLYGNGQPGLVKDVVLIQNSQDQCPARQAATVAGKRLGIAYIMMVIAVIGIIVTIAIALHS